MPNRPPQVCATPGCNQLTTTTRCPTHTTTTASAGQTHVYNSKRWQRLRRRILKAHPVCQYPHCTTLATPIDHIVPLRDGGDPYDPANLQALCISHHNAKTRLEG